MSSSRVSKGVQRFVRRSWSALLVGALATGAVVAAVEQPGLRASDNHLDDAQVYVSNGTAERIGALNSQIDDLSASAASGGPDFDLTQDGTTVLVHQRRSRQLALYDPARNTVGSALTLPRGTDWSYGGGVLAVASEDTGDVWFGNAAAMVGTDLSRAQSQLNVGPHGQVVVTSSGQVIGLNVTSRSVVRLVDGHQTSTPIPGRALTASNPQIAVSAVGERLVLWRQASSEIWEEGWKSAVAVSGADASGGAQLLPPVPAIQAASADAVIATRAGLVGVSPKRVTLLSATTQDAAPITPVQVGSCLYGVNGSTLSSVCRGARATQQPIAGVQNAGDLVFAANRGTVALNDRSSGAIWLVQKGMKRITNWAHVTPVVKTGQRSNKSSPVDQGTHKDTGPPTAPPQTFVARAGQTTPLPVLDRCTDPDGDILTVSAVGGDGEGHGIEITGHGTGVQVSLGARLGVSYAFTYTVSDGYHSTRGTLFVTSESPDQKIKNLRPNDIHPNVDLLVGRRGHATRHVLNDWRDPDGDALQLVGAEVLGHSGSSITWTPDGTITFSDSGKGFSQQTVRVSVGDGYQVTTADLPVKVSAATPPPVVNGDYVQTRTNVSTVISPLANDEDAPTLAKVEELSNGSAVWQQQPNGTIVFQAHTAGSYYLRYTAFNGQAATGLIRVDVVDASGDGHPPVAARDTVLLSDAPAKALLDPLLNDSDPDGDVLVVQSVDSSPALSVSLSDRHLVSLQWRGVPTGPVHLTYLISDGRFAVTGEIVVLPVHHVDQSGPTAVTDSIKVRAGQTGTADVLANDTSPLGLDLRVAPQLPGGGENIAFVEANMVKVSVPANTPPGLVTVRYMVLDSNGASDVGFLDVTVVAANAPNNAPQPQEVEARVLSGTTTRIQIPLDGIDPDGDSVRLRGLASAPHLGWVEVGEGYLIYHAMAGKESRGTDTFSYEVADAQGLSARGTLRVGVVQRAGQSTTPVAVPDSITVRPGHQVTLDVLANDYDTDGLPLQLVRDAVTFPGQRPAVVGTSSIQFTAPDTPTNAVGTYEVSDTSSSTGSGLTAEGAFTVNVDRLAPNIPPIARDDTASLADVEKSSGHVAVNVLANDVDPDDPRSGLTVKVLGDDGVATVLSDQRISVQVGQATRQVRYQITDPDGASAEATLTVPGRGDDLPHVRQPDRAVEVVAGQTQTMQLNDLVTGSLGRRVRLVDVHQVSALDGTVAANPQQVSLTAPQDFAGPTAICFPVVDDVPASQHPKTAWVTIPVTVKRPASVDEATRRKIMEADTAPVGQNPVVPVAQGEPTLHFDLRSHFTDPEGDAFHFAEWTFTGQVSGLSATCTDDGQCTATASASAALGGRFVLQGAVIDAPGARADVSVTFLVVSSTRPLPVAGPDTVTATAGKKTVVPVLDNDHAFLPNDATVKLVGEPSFDASQVDAEADDTAGTVTVTPKAGFAGTALVHYTIRDDTSDPSRHVQGTITVNVIAPPGAPGVPVQQSVGDGTFTVKFTPAAANGSPVTQYTYTATPTGDGPSVSNSCTGNVCVVTGVRDGVPYTVTVKATNSVGTGPASAPSAAITPDVKPEAPTGVTAAGGLQKIVVSWNAAVAKGSPVSAYQVQMSSAGQHETRSAGKATSFVWTGLPVGQQATFQVQAVNAVGPSDWSQASNADHASDYPQAPTEVQALDHGGADGGWIDVRWKPPASLQGDPITCYQITISGVGDDVTTSCLPPAAGDEQGYAFKTAVNGKPYTFTVRAQNRLGAPGGTGATATATAFAAPSPPTDATLTPKDGCVEVSNIIVKSGGAPITGYAITTQPASSAGKGETDEPASAFTYCGLDNGTTYTVLLKASSGHKVSSDFGSVGTVTPVGTPPAPGLAVQEANSDAAGQRWLYLTKFTDISQTHGTPPNQLEYDMSINGGDWNQVQPGRISVPVSGASISVSVRVKAGSLIGDASTPVTVNAPLSASIDDSGIVHLALDGWTQDQTVSCTLEVNGAKQSLDKQTITNNGAQLTFPTAMVTPGASPAPGPTHGDIACTGDQSHMGERAGVDWPR